MPKAPKIDRGDKLNEPQDDGNLYDQTNPELAPDREVVDATEPEQADVVDDDLPVLLDPTEIPQGILDLNHDPVGKCAAGDGDIEWGASYVTDKKGKLYHPTCHEA